MILVIGYGNRLRGDDGVGPYIIERLASHQRNAVLEVLSCQQLMPELMEPMSKARRVIFIDACVGDTPGAIRHYPIVTQAEAFTPGVLGHHLSPEMLVAGTCQLYGNCPEAEIISIVGANFEMGAALSEAVAAAMHEVIRLVHEYVQDNSLAAET